LDRGVSRSQRSSAITGVAIVLFLLAVLAVWYLGRSSPSGPPAAPSTSGVPGASGATLESLAIAAPGPMSGYSRDRFPHWVSSGDSCDTREIVLQRQGTDVVRDTSCRATSGKWASPYDGVQITDAGKVDIDHMVPLAEAWRSGAASWTDERRKQFANDLTNPQLFAVTAASNRSKGDQDPAHWKPPSRSYWCTYAQQYVTVKAAYQLSVDQAEHDALAEMLAACR
jgi:hypothetical protein